MHGLTRHGWRYGTNTEHLMRFQDRVFVQFPDRHMRGQGLPHLVPQGFTLHRQPLPLGHKFRPPADHFVPFSHFVLTSCL
jgi:hypothetical protein